MRRASALGIILLMVGVVACSSPPGRSKAAFCATARDIQTFNRTHRLPPMSAGALQTAQQIRKLRAHATASEAAGWKAPPGIVLPSATLDRLNRVLTVECGLTAQTIGFG